MGQLPPPPRDRSGRRNLAGSLRTGLHTVTVQMRQPSRFVPLMVAVGIGAFLAFGWPLIARTQGPHVDLNDENLQHLVDVHRGSTNRSSLAAFTEVKALVHFEALPAVSPGETQASFVALRGSRVRCDRPIRKVLDGQGTYETSMDGVTVQVRRSGDAIHVLLGGQTWPTIDLPETI